jgi:hypothetical protein
MVGVGDNDTEGMDGGMFDLLSLVATWVLYWSYYFERTLIGAVESQFTYFPGFLHMKAKATIITATGNGW